MSFNITAGRLKINITAGRLKITASYGPLPFIAPVQVTYCMIDAKPVTRPEYKMLSVCPVMLCVPVLSKCPTTVEQNKGHLCIYKGRHVPRT